VDPQEVQLIAKALADRQRREILEATAQAGELTCARLCESLPVSQATISHHLKELTVAGLLTRRQDGPFAWYRFEPAVMASYLTELEGRFGLRPTRRPRNVRSA
jgi:ArsR family transcriptional regulator